MRRPEARSRSRAAETIPDPAPVPSAAPGAQARRVTVVGAGLMGTEIGLDYALGGHLVTLVDRAEDALDRSRSRARDSAAFLTRVGLVAAGRAADAGRRMRRTTDIETGVDDADIVIEAVDEDFQLKVRLLGTVARRNATATIATNTSALSVQALGEAAGAPERVIGTHYMNPPTLMPIVEVVPSDATEPPRTQRMLELLRAMGKEAVLVADVPGFITNRLQLALLREAVALVDAGVATPETIDLIARRGFGRRWSLAGPFESMAAGGPATLARVADEVFPYLASPTDGAAFRRVRLPAEADLEVAIARRNEGFASLLLRDRGLAPGRRPAAPADPRPTKTDA